MEHWDENRIDLSKPCKYHKNKPQFDGYVMARFGGPKVYAHKYMWESKYGAVPDGLQLDHICNNRSCIEPDHCAPVTPSENIKRQERCISLTCKNGHVWTDDNTRYYTSGGRTRRQCISCSRIRSKEWHTTRK